MRTRVAVIVTLLALAGCSATSGPGATPATAQQVAITPQVLGMLLEEHVGAASVVAGGADRLTVVKPTEFVDRVTATAYYRATPGRPARTLTVGYSPTPYDGSFGCPGVGCEDRDGVWVRSGQGYLDLVAGRDEGFVEVYSRDADIPDDLLDAAAALARDSRSRATVDSGLASAAAANPRWRGDDLGCGDAAVSGPIALPAAAGGTPEAVTPQALAAVVASRVAGSCAGDEGSGSTVRGTVFVGSDGERASLAVADEAFGCGQLESCRRQDGVTIGWAEAADDTEPERVFLSRRAADGRHWVVVEADSMTTKPGSAGSAFPLATLLALVTDERVGPSVDPALNRAGDALPLRWRFTPRTVE